jgi:GDP-L-fucose synthase
MKILITGANGYVGKSLYSALKNKYNITIITRVDLDLIDSGEVAKFFRDKYFDIILHCAVEGGSRLKDDNYEIMDRNLCMYYNLLQCQSSYGKFIHFGSGAEIYNSESPYGLSKKIIAKSISEIENFYNIRIFGVFDKNELNTRFIKTNIKRYLNNEPIIIHQNKQMDFFYMKDLVLLIDYYILNNNPPKEIDCTYPESKTLYDIANIINHLDKYKVNIKLEKNNLDKNYTGNFTDISLPYNGIVTGIIETCNQLKNEH